MFHISTNVQSDKIQQQISVYNGKVYNTLSYDEDVLCTDDMDTGMYRSTIVAIPERKLLAFAPPKTISITKFKTLYPTLDNIVMHEYIDGRMLQLYYDKRILSWRLTPLVSKNEYVIPHIDEHAFIIAMQGNMLEPLNNLAVLEMLPKNYCYTFTIRTQRTFQSSLYLLAVYQIQESNLILPIPQNEYQSWPVFADVNGVICFPKPCIIGNSYADFAEDVLYTFVPKKWVLTNNQTGLQTTISTNEYKLMKRSAELNEQTKYQYLCLQRIGKQDDYLKHMSSRKREFYEIKHLYDWFIRSVHELYIAYYITKTADKLPMKYKTHIEQIHQLYYINSLNRKTPTLITKHIVKKYFDKKDPHELKYLLNNYEYISTESA